MIVRGEDERSQAPSRREHVEHIRAKLAEQFQTLNLLEHELKQRPGHNIDEQVRVDKVSAAIEYLALAMDALELAVGD